MTPRLTGKGPAVTVTSQEEQLNLGDVVECLHDQKSWCQGKVICYDSGTRMYTVEFTKRQDILPLRKAEMDKTWRLIASDCPIVGRRRSRSASAETASSPENVNAQKKKAKATVVQQAEKQATAIHRPKRPEANKKRDKERKTQKEAQEVSRPAHADMVCQRLCFPG